MQMRRITILLVAVVALSAVSLAASAEHVLYNFTGGADGALPHSSLTYHDGSFYGATAAGGATDNGVVFRLQRVGNNWVETVLYAFTGDNDGLGPFSDVVFDAAGNIYGNTTFGGTNGFGDIYKLTPSGSGYTESIIHTFTGGADGGSPSQAGKLLLDGRGNVYGTTLVGGAFNFGAVFELTPAGSGYTESVLYSFTGGADGAAPEGNLIRRGSSLFGVTFSGGEFGFGTVFRLTLSAGIWTEKVLYSFTGGADGGAPFGGLVFDESGNLYGTTSGEGGLFGDGTVFQLKNSSAGWTQTVLHSFIGGEDGQSPEAALILGPNGNLYGTTVGLFLSGPPFGTVFQLSPSQSGWTQTVLHNFAGGSDGEYCFGAVVFQGGTLYGTTRGGGSQGEGTIFEVAP
jgi:uncharacterized repeat protein (TIGR03803 family)